MDSYVPNTSRRVFGFFVIFWGGSLCLAAAARSFFPRFSVFLIVFDQFFLEFYFWGRFSILRHRTLCPKDFPDPLGPPHTPTPAPPQPTPRTPPGVSWGREGTGLSSKEGDILERFENLSSITPRNLDYPSHTPGRRIFKAGPMSSFLLTSTQDP